MFLFKISWCIKFVRLIVDCSFNVTFQQHRSRVYTFTSTHRSRVYTFTSTHDVGKKTSIVQLLDILIETGACMD